MQVRGRGGPGSEPYQDRRLAGAEWHMRRQKRRCPVLGPGGLRARSPRRSLVTPSKFSTELRGIPAQVPEVRRLSPLEGDGLELLVPRQESPGFPKHPGSGRDGRGPICLTPPSHQARALGRADTSPYQRVRFARPESTVSPTTAPSPSATIAVMSAIV